MKWNLRMVAAQRDIWRPTQLQTVFAEVGFTPSLSKVAALWSGKPVTVRLEDLDKICAALDCAVADLMQAEPEFYLASREQGERRVVGARHDHGAAGRPVPGNGRGLRGLPPN
jgi:DNA-binding Xre family transcriptional regulator